MYSDRKTAGREWPLRFAAGPMLPEELKLALKTKGHREEIPGVRHVERLDGRFKTIFEDPADG